MNLIETINTGSVILIGYNPDCEKYIFSELDSLFNISYVDYKSQPFSEDDYIINDTSYMRDTKISLLLSEENNQGYHIINLNNFVPKDTTINKSMGTRNLVRSISSKSYVWSNQNLKIRTIILSHNYKGPLNETAIRGGSSIMFSCDLVLSIQEVGKLNILKNHNSPCSTVSN
jgi:hypothetical protein